MKSPWSNGCLVQTLDFIYEVFMKNEIIFKIIGAIVTILSVMKIIYDITTGEKSRLQEDYKFAKEFLEEIEDNPSLHPFVIEKGYHAIAGSRTLGSEVIAYLLSLKNPGKCLRDYILSNRYLQIKIINTDGYLRIEFAKMHSSDGFRLIQKIFYGIGYFFCATIVAIIAISPLFVPYKYVVAGIVTLPVFGYYGVLSLKEYIKISRAEALVKNQQRRI